MKFTYNFPMLKTVLKEMGIKGQNKVSSMNVFQYQQVGFLQLHGS